MVIAMALKLNVMLLRDILINLEVTTEDDN